MVFLIIVTRTARRVVSPYITLPTSPPARDPQPPTPTHVSLDDRVSTISSFNFESGAKDAAAEYEMLQMGAQLGVDYSEVVNDDDSDGEPLEVISL